MCRRSRGYRGRARVAAVVIVVGPSPNWGRMRLRDIMLGVTRSPRCTSSGGEHDQ